MPQTSDKALKTTLFSKLRVDIHDRGEVSYLSGVLEHPGQRFVHFSPYRYIVLMWGRRTGKTIAAAAEVVWELSQKNKRIWIVAPNYELTDRVFEYVWRWIVVDEIFGPGAVVRKAKTKDNRYIQLSWGSWVKGKSAEAPSSLIGEQLDLIVIDEAARCLEKVWVEALEPCTVDRKGRVIFVSTPVGKNWFNDYYERGFKPDTQDKGWLSLRLTIYDNPFVDKDWIRSKEAETPPHVWRREYLASPEEYSGLVYPEFKNFDKSMGGHLFDPEKEPFDSTWTVYGAIDVGWRHPSGALLGSVDPQNNLWIHTEYEEQGYVHDDHAKNIKMRWPKPVYMWAMSPDATREAGLHKDDRGKCPQDVYRANGIFARPAFDNVMSGVGIGNDYFRATLLGDQATEPKVYISKNCEKLIYALERYVMEEPGVRVDRDAPERPRKKDDDLMDAFRYLVAMMPRYTPHWNPARSIKAGPERYGHQGSRMEQARRHAKPVTPGMIQRGGSRILKPRRGVRR